MLAILTALLYISVDYILYFGHSNSLSFDYLATMLASAAEAEQLILTAVEHTGDVKISLWDVTHEYLDLLKYHSIYGKLMLEQVLCVDRMERHTGNIDYTNEERGEEEGVSVRICL